ncbi:arginyltransferase [Brevundimonas sp.]|uniref:arginyltransferase n=1 Tax=Brevundimonas sp. TaxID=1871086 RepID=UPI0025D90263|nr:arginyltransferase [Brevundimonas sp.]
MTQHVPSRQLRFFLTGPSPCPYLPGKFERKVFAHLPMSDGALVNDSLTQVGFRRSQNIAYRPACEACDSCLSARIPVADFVFSRSQRKILNRNADLTRTLVEAEATAEQFELLQRYLHARHPNGGMNEMGWLDYVAMVEDTAVRTHVIEYRQPEPHGPGRLVACILVDLLSDGLSLVYSFFDPTQPRRSLGQFIVLDHLRQAQTVGLEHVYLGYWVQGSPKMDYKSRFRPLEVLRPEGWTRVTDVIAESE